MEGEIFPLVAGAAASLGLLELWLVILITFVGAVIGDIILVLDSENGASLFATLGPSAVDYSQPFTVVGRAFC